MKFYYDQVQSLSTNVNGGDLIPRSFRSGSESGLLHARSFVYFITRKVGPQTIVIKP